MSKAYKQKYSDLTHWLMKNEPPFSLANLQTLPNQREPWVGVRSREARNLMQYEMKIGQQILYYNASVANPHIAGIARVCSEPYPDYTAFDPASKYYDRASDKANPTWYMVDVEYVRTFKRPIYLSELRLYQETKLKDFIMFRRFRLSICPLTDEQWEFLCGLEHEPIPPQVLAGLKKEKKSEVSSSAEQSTGSGAQSQGDNTQATSKKKAKTASSKKKQGSNSDNVQDAAKQQQEQKNTTASTKKAKAASSKKAKTSHVAESGSEEQSATAATVSKQKKRKSRGDDGTTATQSEQPARRGSSRRA